MIPSHDILTQTFDPKNGIIQFVNLALSNTFRERKTIRFLFLYHFNNWAVDQADGQSVKLLNRIIVSSWMGDPMATGCQAHGSWISLFSIFSLHKIYF